MLDQIEIEKENERQSLYDSLISVLKKEIDVYKDLYSSFLSEQEVLVRSSVEELYENNSIKETCILNAGMLSETRGKLVEKISGLLDMDNREVYISTLISHADNRQKGELTECRSQLRSLMTQISEMNEKNKILINSSLLYVQKSIAFISQLLSPSSTYQNTGELKVNSMNGQILCRKG